MTQAPTPISQRARALALFLVVCQAVLLLTAIASAQDRDEDEDEAEGFGAFLVGAGVFDLASLNDRLIANDYEAIDGAMTLLGGEGHAVLDSGFVIGGRGAAILGPQGDGPGNVRTDFAGGFGMLDLGFALIHTKPMLLTLTAGIGGYGLNLAIGDESGARFNAVLRDPKRGTSLSHGGFLTALTLGFDGRVPVGRSEDGRQGFFTLGLRAGGLYGPSIGEWSLPEGADATAGPSGGLTGAYALIAIGFGGHSVESEDDR